MVGAAAPVEGAAIPVAAAPVKNHLSASDRLDRLARVASPIAAKDDKDKDRKVMPLSPEDETHLNRFVFARELKNVCEAAQGVEDIALKTSLMLKWTADAWTARNIPANPIIRTYRDQGRQTPYNSGVFMVVALYSFPSVPKPKDREPGRTPKDYIFTALTNGTDPLSMEVAARLIENEIRFDRVIGTRQITELLEGHYEDKTWVPATPEEVAVGEKFYDIMMANDIAAISLLGAFTDEERRILFIQGDEVPKVINKADFAKNALSYAATLAQYRHILSVCRPQLQIGGVKFAENGDPTENPRLVAAKEILLLEAAPDATKK